MQVSLDCACHHAETTEGHALHLEGVVLVRDAKVGQLGLPILFEQKTPACTPSGLLQTKLTQHMYSSISTSLTPGQETN